MEDLLKSYSERAKIGLRKIHEGDAKSHLENLIKYTMFKAKVPPS